MDNKLALLTLCGSIIALLFAATRAQKVLRFPEGNDTMVKIAASIRSGAMAYLKRQYRILLIFFAGMFLILTVMAACGFLTWFVPFAFITGGFFSGPVRIRGYEYSDPGECAHCGGLPKGAEQGT